VLHFNRAAVAATPVMIVLPPHRHTHVAEVKCLVDLQPLHVSVSSSHATDQHQEYGLYRCKQADHPLLPTSFPTSLTLPYLSIIPTFTLAIRPTTRTILSSIINEMARSSRVDSNKGQGHLGDLRERDGKTVY
jgi:hypothetical protein